MRFAYNPIINNLDLIGITSGGGGSVTPGDIPVFSDATGDLADSGFAFPIPVAGGGTGDTSFTAYSVITGGTTSTGNLQNVSGVGTSGQILTSNGAGALPTWQNAPASGVTSVSGTANRITSTGGSTPVIDIAATYVGQTSITTLGTITTGTWSGTTIGVSKGGTGATTLTAHGVLVGEGTSAVTALAVGATGAVLMGSTGADPAFTTAPTIAGNTTISGSFTMNGGMIEKRTATAISYTVLVTDVIVAVTDTTAARTITMPNSGLVAGQRWTIKDESGGAATHAITISGNGANVDGSSTQIINTNYGSVDIYCNGTNFFLV